MQKTGAATAGEKGRRDATWEGGEASGDKNKYFYMTPLTA